MQISIYQGRSAPPSPADITVIIDVIRAFTVTHYAFLQGASQIFLAETSEQAFQMKKLNPDILLVGEIDGFAIDGFDLDNSPYRIQQVNFADKSLVLKTTNGVRAALNCLDSEHVFVTGFTNARNTAQFMKEMLSVNKWRTMHIIASHPSGDDDLACAAYMKDILEESSNPIQATDVAERIMRAHTSEKFFDKNNAAFMCEDILASIRELDTDFVMKVNNTGKIPPMIERVQA